MDQEELLDKHGKVSYNKIQVYTYAPSIITLRASLITVRVEMMTRIENRNVQIGSANFHSGCKTARAYLHSA
jgi:hypothetical protein